MKIYVVCEYEYEDTNVIAVCTTKEIAEREKRKHWEENKQYIDGVYIEEHEIIDK